MDKAIYALRDVTSTVSSIPLIASSIMSKKIASGADKIIIDIKVGNGALIQTKADAKKLSELMIKIGEFYDREVRTIISDMNTPLGKTIGNSLEVLEAIDVLRGVEKNNSFVDLCVELATNMVSMSLGIPMKEANKKVLESIDNQSAYHKFEEMVKAQKGDLSKIKVSNHTMFIKSPVKGTIEKINALEFGKLSLRLGAGKENIDDKIDYTVGIKLNKLVGDKVKKGDILATIYYKKKVPEISFDNIYKIS
jgi:pyrimidine-nucleoside phosphorylase